MSDKDHPKRLFVEGDSDKRVIPFLIGQNNIDWPRDNVPVYIHPLGGKDKVKRFINDPDEISTELKLSGRKAIGLIIDADSGVEASWQSFRDALRRIDDPKIPDVPAQIPAEGFIGTSENGVRVGVWIMPDNVERGMMETFLAFLIDDKHEPVWQFAQSTVEEAKERGATFKDAHVDKAKIYTWLAWQDEPGFQLHVSLKEKILNPAHPKAQPFVTWFKTLFDL